MIFDCIKSRYVSIIYQKFCIICIFSIVILNILSMNSHVPCVLYDSNHNSLDDIFFFSPFSADDSFEENDNFSQARLISPGFYEQLFQNDDDWYKLIPNAEEQNGKRIFFNITTSFPINDFNVEILDADSNSLVNLTKSDNNYFGTYDLYSELNIFIHIFTNQTSIVRYSLKITSINLGKFHYIDPFGIIPAFPTLWLGFISIVAISYTFFYLKKNNLTLKCVN
ncbi:hypothetical protein [Candidatus Harpocratesius sp.]